MSHQEKEALSSTAWKISDIALVPYGDTLGGTVLSCEPSHDDIQRALDGGHLEHRNYQLDFEALVKEWKSGTNDGRDHAEWVRLVSTYHARRVAYFVVCGWHEPITITSNGRITDGSHRIRAAIYKGLTDIEVRFE